MIPLADRLQEVKEYYFSIKLKEVRRLIQQGKPIINMGIGSPDLQPPSEVTHALRESDIHGYQSYQGIPELRRAMADFYQNHYGVALNFENEVLPLMGSKEGILHVSMAFLNEGDGVLIPNPGYPTYASVSKLVQARLINYDLSEENGWWPDFDSLEKEDLSGVKLMWVNYPHMPTGSNGSRELYERLVQFGKEHNILIINDNPYSFILNDQPLSILSVEGAKDTCIELNSLSKTFNMAGWRVGMFTGNEAFLSAILKVKSNMDSGMFYGIQQGAVKALQISPKWFDDINEVYEERRQLIWKICELLNCTYDRNSSGLFVWARLPEGEDAERFCDSVLYEKDVFITPGFIFGTNGEGYIRFSLCLDSERIKEVERRLSTDYGT